MGSGGEVLVSIFCLTYNHGKYIRDALDGFILQKTQFDYEVIIYDDASTDNTAEIIRSYADNYPDIIKPVLQKENQFSKGIHVFSEFFLPRVRGKYIAICEGDDYWCDENKLQRQVSFLEQNADYSGCTHQSNVLDMFRNDTRLYSVKTNKCDLEMEEIIHYWGRLFHFSSVICRTSLFKSNNQWKELDKVESMIGDFPLALLMRTNGKVHYFPIVMSVYRYGVQESYSEQVYNNKVKQLNTLKDEIRLLERFDCITTNKYHEAIERRKTLQLIRYYNIKREYKKIEESGYPMLKTVLGYKRTIKIFLYLHIRGLYNIMFKINKK